MIIIKDIDIIEVPTDKEIELLHSLRTKVGGRVSTDVAILNEAIKGRRFTNQEGKTICIGMTKEVQNLIGLPFEAFDNLEKAYDRVSNLHYESQQWIRKVKSKKWWERIVLVFTGYNNI
jgi:hypothetical protein